MQVSLEDFRSQVTDLLNLGLPDAETRFQRLETYDPYPDIPPSLLHSGHLASYVAMTGMIEPFDIAALQKPATYLVPLEGPVRYRDKSGQYQRFHLSMTPVPGVADVRESLVLQQNSLCYVTLQPVFRMPGYIAGRFNLLIRDVYRGLLVGTGPLVDPGFIGRLSIPLHNFTSNEYVLRAGDGFVYFEFTKLSWTNDTPPRPDIPWLTPPISVQPPFPGSKNLRRNIDDYLDTATGGPPAENAIGSEIRRLSDATATIAQGTRVFTIAGYAGIIGLGIATFGALLTAWEVYLGAQQVVQNAQHGVDAANEKFSDQVQTLRSQINDAVSNISQRSIKVEQSKTIEAQIDEITHRLKTLEDRVTGVPSQQPTARGRGAK
jgi:deoxycytidine triphosphate deaminase